MAVATGPGSDNDFEKVPGMLNCRSERGRRREGAGDGTQEVSKEKGGNDSNEDERGRSDVTLRAGENDRKRQRGPIQHFIGLGYLLV